MGASQRLCTGLGRNEADDLVAKAQFHCRGSQLVEALFRGRQTLTEVEVERWRRGSSGYVVFDVADSLG